MGSPSQRSIKALNAVTADESTSESFKLSGRKLSFQAVATTSAGSGAAVVKVEVSNSGSHWEEMGSITLAPNQSDSDGFSVATSGWKYTRMRVDSISGTDCTVSAWIGCE